MAITKITSSRNIVAAIQYITEEESHDGIHPRIGSIRTQNLTVSHAKEEVMNVLRRNHTVGGVQAYLVIQSFDTDELDPNNQEDIEKANQIGYDLATSIGGEDRQVMVVTQADNGYVHNHIIIANRDMITGKALRGEKTGHKYVSNESDRIIEKHKVLNKNKDMQKGWTERVSCAEKSMREKQQYVWKDDLRGRIEAVADTITSFDDFRSQLQEQGVEVRIRGDKVSYSFKDNNGKQRKCREAKLGNIYGKEGIDYAIAENISRENTRESDYSQYTVTFNTDKYTSIDAGSRNSSSQSENTRSSDTTVADLTKRLTERNEKLEREQCESEHERLRRYDDAIKRFRSSIEQECNDTKSERTDDYEF